MAEKKTEDILKDVKPIEISYSEKLKEDPAFVLALIEDPVKAFRAYGYNGDEKMMSINGGGEPFLRQDILTLLRYAAAKGILLSFSTNASLVTEEVASALYELRNSLFYIQMSLYGESRETYEGVTGSRNNMELALKGLANLVERGLDVAVLTVATAENVDRIPEYGGARVWNKGIQVGSRGVFREIG